MRIRNLSLTTQKKYMKQVAAFANHFHKSPQLLGIEDIRAFLLYLARERKLTSSSILVHLALVEEEYSRFAKSKILDLTVNDKERIQALASDLPRVWRDPQTSARDRKRMLRLLIENVTLVRDKLIQIQIRWKGGATTCLEKPLPLSAPELYRISSQIVEQIWALATQETDRQIAQKLNARELRSGREKPFTPRSVKDIRATYGIDSFHEHLRKAGWLSEAEMAKQITVHPTTARRFAREGILRALRANDKRELLFAPIAGPAGKRFKNRPRHYQSISNMTNGVQYEAWPLPSGDPSAV